MPSPFPGMDPYLENPEIFPDFHDSFITYLRWFWYPFSGDALYAVCRALFWTQRVTKAVLRTRGAGHGLINRAAWTSLNMALGC